MAIKINSRGQYQPFYGYTVVAMTQPSVKLDLIQNHIKTSSLNRFFSPLPSDTYHMTIFNIYVVDGPVIGPVKAWVDKGGVVSANRWLPDEAIAKENLKAFNLLDSQDHNFSLTKCHLKGGRKSLGIKVQMSNNCYGRVQALRSELGKIYDHDDPALGARDRFHITLAYGFKKPVEDAEFVRDYKKLCSLVKDASGDFKKLQKPELYLFGSMTNYIPFKEMYT